MKKTPVTEVNSETLDKLLQYSDAILKGDYSKRIVSDFNDNTVNRLINNLNQHADNLMVSGSKAESTGLGVDQFINIISSFANRDFNHKLTVSEHGTIMDAIATGINLLGDELQHSTISKAELEVERNSLNEAQALAKLGSCEINLETKEFTGSQEMYRLFGLEKTPANRRFEIFRNRYHPDDLHLLDMVLEKPGNYAAGFSFEHRIIRTSGNIKYFSCLGQIEERQGKPYLLKGSVQDITQRKTAEMELHNSLQMVIEQNKRLQNFSYIISHNLRSHSSNFTSLLKLMRETETRDECLEIADHMERVSELLNETLLNLHDILSIQEKVNLIVEPINLHDAVNEAIAVLSKQIEAKKAIIHNNIPKEKKVDCNPAYLESIIFNFLSNAVKYSHPGRRPEITVDLMQLRRHLVLRISDNGVGIDMEKYGDKLFGMYKTFHGNHDARGIGLFISKNQVEAMGGRIEVESEVDKGTVFKIYLK